MSLNHEIESKKTTNLNLSKAMTNVAAWTITTAAVSVVKSFEALEMSPRGPGIQESALLSIFLQRPWHNGAEVA